MSTSGTVGATTIDTAKLLDHAFRRCGVPPQTQTPELVESAKETLFMLLTHIANRGLNLWAVEKHILGLVENQATYTLPTGTISVLNALHCSPVSRYTGTATQLANTYEEVLDDASDVARIGVKFSAFSGTTAVAITGSADGVTYVSLGSIPLADVVLDKWLWLDLDPIYAGPYFKVDAGAVMTVSDFYLASDTRDLEMSPFNRDTYVNLNTKTSPGRPSTSFFFEKKLAPQITLWPRPSDDTDQLVVWIHRQVQDVGTLSQSLAIPSRWHDTVLSHLSFRMALEIPGVDPARLNLLKSMAGEFEIQAESEEVDGAPIYFAPMIGAYTA